MTQAGSDHLPWIGGVLPRRELARVAVLAMELSLVVPWLRLLTRSSQPPQGMLLLAWFLAWALLARWTTEASERFNLRSGVSIVVSAVLLALGMLLSINLVIIGKDLFDLSTALIRFSAVFRRAFPIPHEIYAGLAMMIAWRRGYQSVAESAVLPARTGFKFRLGVLVFAAYMIATLPLGQGGVPDLMPVFFGASLLAMALTRADWLLRGSGGGEPPFTWGWLGSLTMLFAAAILLGLAVGRALGSPLAYATLALAGALLVFLFQIAFIVFYPFFLAITPLLTEVLERLRAFFMQLQQAFDQGKLLIDPDAFASEAEAPERLRFLDSFLEFIQPYWPAIQAGLILGLFLLLGWLVVRRAAARQGKAMLGADTPGQGESALPEDALGGLGRRLRSVGKDVAGLGRALLAGRLTTVLAVRRIYARLLRLASKQGRTRRPSETPLEYLVTLQRMFPERAEAVGQITQAYVLVRYGEVPEDADMLGQVRQAWQSIKEAYA